MSNKGTCYNNIFSKQTVPTRIATSCGLCEVIRNQTRQGIKKDRTNIFRVCMLSYCTFITNTSVVSSYVGLTSFFESLWPDSLSTPSWKATGCSLRDRFLRDTSRLFEGRCENDAELIWLQSKHTQLQGTLAAIYVPHNRAAPKKTRPKSVASETNSESKKTGAGREANYSFTGPQQEGSETEASQKKLLAKS